MTAFAMAATCDTENPVPLPEDGQTSGPRRALVVEDEKLVALHIAGLLRRRGFEVLTPVAHAEEAITAARDLHPDLVLMDINLPGGVDGIEAAGRIREGNEAAVVFLTAYSDPVTLERALTTSPAGYVVKPFTEQGLVCAVEVAMARQREAGDSKRLAMTDPLTGLLNRRAFLARARQHLESARRQGRPVALLYLDVDRLKQINDGLGHAQGDEVIRRAGALLANTLRHTDVVARLGGDEFAAFLVDSPELGARRLVERLGARMVEDNLANPDAPKLRMSIGLSVADDPGHTTIEELLDQADRAMYRCKASRRRTPR